jgi:hypothetical protein
MFKRFLSVFIAVVMLLTVVGIEPAAAASQTAAWDGTVDISWYDPNAMVYDISTPAQLAGLAALVNGMTDPNCPKIIGNTAYLKTKSFDNVTLVGVGGGNVSDTVYVSNVDFAYKTVRLTADLDMGGVCNRATGTWSGPNWTPIGGKYPLKPGEVKGDCLVLDTRFNGVFEGQGHTVKNIYCDRYAAKGFPYSMAIGLIGYLGGASDQEKNITGTFENGWVPTVRNVIVGKGSIYGRRMVGGVVGRVGTTNNGVVIENCANFADVKNTDSKGVGGVCGTGWGDGIIRNCYNAGSVSTTYSCPAGGICGSNGGMDIYNCYSIGGINSNGEKIGRGIGGHDSGSYTVGNCYYLTGSDDDPLSDGYYKGSTTKVTVSVAKLSASEMQNKTFLDKLNVSGTVFVSDANGINGGFPVLWYQAGSGSANCSVTVQLPSAGGTVTVDKQTATYGQTVNFSAKPNAGWILDHFIVNGKAINTNFYTVTGDIAVSAVFSQVRSVKVSIPQNDEFYFAVARTGYKLSGGEMVWITGECLADGDTVLEGNTLKLLTHGYLDASHPDMNYEYTDGFTFTVDYADKNTDGSYRVKGDGNITIQAERNARRKSWINLADTSWYNAWHPAKSYTLTTAAQLAGLAQLVNDKGVSFTGTAILLGNDISLQNTDGTTGERTWTAIGSSVENSFEGTFDGQRHIISDMAAWNDGSYSGLFGYCNNAAIKNVKVIGSVAGEASASYAAGIAAYASGGTIEKCSVDVDVTASGTHAAGIVAGISDGTVVSGCFSYGKISGSSGVGGIAGVSGTGTDSIIGCGNFGDVSGSGSDTYGVGGIVGRLAGKMDSCVNQGTVTGADRYIGGLVGYATTRYTSILTLSQNTGSVSSNCNNENAAVGGLVGFAQYLSYGGCSNKGTIRIGTSFASPSSGDLIGKTGEIKEITAAGTIPEYHSTPPVAVSGQAAGSFVVTFIAQGKTINSVNCSAGTKSVAEPAIPEMKGYTASWDRYQLSGKDVTIKAVYRQNLIGIGDSITASGTYFIPWFASGQIDIGSGLDVTLKGTDGGGTGFENLVITAGDNTVLTLEDVNSSGTTTLLKLGKDDTLVLKGSNALNGNSDAKNNEQPTVTVQGNLAIQGDGALKIGAQSNNAAVFVVPGSTITQNSGALTIDKKDLLGLAGGAFYATGSKVLIKGGKFNGHTNSDNVAILSADELTISGGTVRVQAERSPQTLASLKTVISGGTIMSIGHSGNSSPEKRYYYSEQSVPNLTAAAGAFKNSSLPFTDVSVDSEYYDAVGYCAGKNYFSGTGATTFSPDGMMTRAMFASVLYRMAGSPSVKGSVPFTDLTQNWYQNAVVWAVQSGITSGTSASAFSPEAPVTREQAALFLSRFAILRGKDISVQGTDLVLPEGTSAWAEEAVGWTLEKGVFKSGSGEMADPGAYASRGLLALALMRYDALK